MPIKGRKIPTRNVDFQIDMIPNLDNYSGGYFSPSKNSITLNYKKGDESWNEWILDETVLAHEQKHRDNRAAGLYEYPVSPEQAYKINMHDEMAAHLRELRFEKAQRSSGNITPPRINALHLANLLEGSVNHYG